MTSRIKTLLSILFLFSIACAPVKEETKESSKNLRVPSWAKDAIWYQIFTERFNNGDNTNDPTLASIEGSWPHTFSDDWKVMEWTSDWYQADSNYNSPKGYYDFGIQSRRYGGDLQGILDKLDYLEELGINAVYINPLNDAPSLHKYDARNFRHIDINFGPDPKGDVEIMEQEDPADPETWKWTNADKQFLKLINELHKRNIRIILDYSWNHTGVKFWAWQDVLENGKESKYADWYEIKQFDNPNTPENEFEYTGWAGVKDLPELKKVDVENRVHGKPYKGNIYDPVKQHIFNVSKRWLDPNGDGNFEDGVDGYRLDVADQIGMDFWRDYRRFVRSINPECYLIGEIWWEKWPDVMMDPRPYVIDGDIFDAIMFYQAYKPARDFFAKTIGYAGAERLKEEWDRATYGIPAATIKGMMMMSASHDSPRLLTSFFNKGKYKFQSKPGDNATYITGKPDEETYKRVKLYLTYQFSMPGAPQIWNGDEMGMWGGDDPDCRKPLWWNGLTFENESSDPFKSEKASYQVGFNQNLNDYYKQLIRLRNDNPVLRNGELRFVKAEGDLLIIERSSEKKKVILVINNSNDKIELPGSINIRGRDLLTEKEIVLTEGGVLNALSALIIKVQ